MNKTRCSRLYRQLTPAFLPVVVARHGGLLITGLLLSTALASAPNAQIAANSNATSAPEWCANYQVPLTNNPGSGRLVLQTSLVAHMRIVVPVQPVRVTLVGLGSSLPVVTSPVQCGQLVVFDQLPPGNYRIASVEGNVSVFSAPERFLFPLPGDNYRIISSTGDTVSYRAKIPRESAAIVPVEAGKTSFAGSLAIVPTRRKSWAVSSLWDHQLTVQTRLCRAFNQAYGQTEPCDPGD